LSGAAAAIISTAVDAFVAALDAYTVDTRNAVLVAAKNSAKLAMISILRTYSAQIRINPGVLNADKLALGLNLPNNSPSPIPPPTTSPLITVIGATPGQHTLRFADQNTPDKRLMPFGVVGLELFIGIGVTVFTDPDQCSYYGRFTKQPIPVNFDPGDAGKLATYFGHWVSRATPIGGGPAPVGPWSNSTVFVIPGM